jgi:hypothetical protein
VSRAHAVQRNPIGRVARGHPGVVKFGRAGWFVKGVVYVVSGVLALLLAGRAAGWSGIGERTDQEASPTGALKTIAQARGGALVLWLLAVGMLMYAAWRVVSALFPGTGGGPKAWATRIGFLVSAVIYTTFAATAVSLARAKPRTQSPDGNLKVSSLSERVMQHTGGRVAIALVGLIVIGAGVYHVVKGARSDVNDELDLSSLRPRRRAWTRRLGALGEIGRGIGIGLIGFFLVRAALKYDSSKATGLDGALRRMASETWGLCLILVVGIGFTAYGLFCLLTFSHRELQAP